MVERFQMKTEHDWVCARPDPKGDWVRLSDYEALRAELEQVKRENQKLRGDCKAYEKTMDAIAVAEAAERLDGARVKVKPLNWEVIQGHSGIWWRASNPFGGLPYEALSESDKERHQADYERRILSALAEPAGEAEPDFAASIAEVIKEESLNEAACGWRPCTGCHETNEGYETGRYSYSTMFGCHVGHGCSECGGLGVVWEYWSKDTLDDMARDITTPPDASAIREAEPCQFLPTEDGEFNGNTFSDEPVPFGWITQRAYDHAYTTSDPVQVTILRTESGPGLMPRVPLYTTPPGASAIREAEPCQFLPTEDGEFNGNTFSDEPVPFGWITQRAYDHAYTTSDPVQVTILRTESGPGLMPRVPLYTTPPGASAIRGAAIQLLSAIDTGCGRDEIISQTGPLRAVLAGAKP